jgi:hypothetical protein
LVGTKTPIALFTYNRPKHVRLLLETLTKCKRLDECEIHIFCDGPKSREHEAGVAESRAVVQEYSAALGAEVVERVENLGLARSIVSGVSKLCSEYGRTIVVEDDFAVSPGFIDFMLQGLDRYQDESNVYQISGYMFPVTHAPKPDAFFLPMATTWGWATWERAWRIFDWDATSSRTILSDSRVRKRFDLEGSYPYAAMLEQRLEGKNDSWGILFWWAIFKANGLVLHPRQSLVWNGGFDSSGTHCGDYSWSNAETKDGFIEQHNQSTFELPQSVDVDEAAFRRIKTFLRRQQYPSSLTGRLWRRATNLVGGLSYKSLV